MLPTSLSWVLNRGRVSVVVGEDLADVAARGAMVIPSVSCGLHLNALLPVPPGPVFDLIYATLKDRLAGSVR